MWMDENCFKKKRCGVSSLWFGADDTLQLIYGGVYQHERERARGLCKGLDVHP